LTPGLFLPLVCLASLGKAICGVAAGAANGATDLHFAKNGAANGAVTGAKTDLSEIMAKNGAQETAVKLVGLSLSYWFSKFANQSSRSIWVTFFSLTAFHVYANYRALRCLQLRTLNKSRLAVIVPHFLAAQTDAVFSPDADALGGLPQKHLLRPREAAQMESILGIPGKAVKGKGHRARLRRISVGSSLSRCLDVEERDPRREGITRAALAKAVEERRRYALVPSGRHLRSVSLLLSVQATEEDKLRAILQAHVFTRCMDRLPQSGNSSSGSSGSSSSGSSTSSRTAVQPHALDVLERSYAVAQRLWPAFRESLVEAGWEIDNVLVEDAGWRWS